MSSHDFHQLSPLDFEGLVRDLIQAELEVRMESFGPGRDSGIDFRFSRADKSTVVQAKHYGGSSVSALLRAARGEDAKVARLKPQRYILATSVSLTPHQKQALIAAMPNAPLASEDVLGREDLNNLLSRHPTVLRQHFKLWLTDVHTLERIIHSGVYNRTDAELDIIKRLVPRFVHNNSVAEAEAILERRGALIIAGEPGVGKTTLARVLTWLHLEQGWKVYVVDDLKEAMAVCTAGEKRLIVFDDFLGQISLTSSTVREVDQRLPVFLDRVKNSKDLRFILTTRSYLMQEAQLQSERLASPTMKAAELVLRVGEYTRRIRAQVVFNHIFFSGLSNGEKQSLLADDFYLKMVDHRNFSPRLIDLLTSPDYQAHQSVHLREVVTRVLDNPSALWSTPYRSHFSDDSRALLVSMFFLSIFASTEDALQAFTRSLSVSSIELDTEPPTSRFRHALKPLEGSMVSISGGSIDFSNPGVRDFLRSVILEDRLLLPTLKKLDSCEELQSAWDFFVDNQDELGETAPQASDWNDAMVRCLRSNVSSRLGVIRLGLSVATKFSDPEEKTLRLVESVMSSLSQYNYEVLCERSYCQAVEGFKELSDDRKALLPSFRVLVEQLAEMLSECGDELSLDEIFRISVTIEESRVLGEGPLQATKESLQGYVQCLRDKLSKITSPDDFEDHDERLSILLKRHDLELAPTEEHQLRAHRSMLDEAYDRPDPGYSPSSTAGRDTDISDEEVKSLFSTLQSGE